MGSALWPASYSSASCTSVLSMKWEMNMIDSSRNDEIDDGGSLLNQANAEPFSVIAKALNFTRS